MKNFFQNKNFFRHPMMLSFFAVVLIAIGLLLKVAPPFSKGDISYIDPQDGIKYVSVDSATVPVKFNAPYDQAISRQIAPEDVKLPNTPLSIRPDLLPAPAPEKAAGTPTPPPIECKKTENSLFVDNSNIVFTNVRWKNQSNGQYGCGTAIPHKVSTGHFWFFDPENIELTCKALYGYNAKYWIFCGALTDVEWWLDAVSTKDTSASKTYYNAPGKMASFGDTSAFSPGSNTPPYFISTTCGSLTPAPSRGVEGYMKVYVSDDQLNDLQVQITSLTPGLNLTQEWNNPVSIANNTYHNVEISAKFSSLTQPGDYWAKVEINDGKTFVSPSCLIGVRIP